MTVLANLRTLRKEKNMTQEGLGEAVGVGQTAISNIENGLVTPSFPLAIRIAKHLGVSLDDLVGDSDEAGSEAIEGEQEPVNA